MASRAPSALHTCSRYTALSSKKLAIPLIMFGCSIFLNRFSSLETCARGRESC